MKLRVDRLFKGNTYTIGKLYIDGVYFCDTLEDRDRGLNSSDSTQKIQSTKVMHTTAIPKGCYDLTIKVISPKYSNYARYSWSKDILGRVPRLLQVPGFEGILIHPGNKHEDTSGCILVGENKVVGKVINSVETFKRLYSKLQEADNKGEEITIQIQ